MAPKPDPASCDMLHAEGGDDPGYHHRQSKADAEAQHERYAQGDLPELKA